jgi:hypothetical protein
MICLRAATMMPGQWRVLRNICARIFRLRLSYGTVPGGFRGHRIVALRRVIAGSRRARHNPKQCFD